MTLAAAEPIIQIVAHTAESVTARVKVDPAEPVFAGHYPGGPLLPGLYLVEYVHRIACLARNLEPTVRPEAVEKVRFLGPVRPGDELTVELTMAGDRCSAKVTGPAGTVSQMRLRYAS